MEGEKVHLSVSNLGRASTSNATLAYISEGEVWLPCVGPISIDEGEGYNLSSPGCGFGVNATNSTKTILNFRDAPISGGEGEFHLFYQKRVIDASTWVSEPINGSIVDYRRVSDNILSSPSVVLSVLCVLLSAMISRREDS